MRGRRRTQVRRVAGLSKQAELLAATSLHGLIDKSLGLFRRCDNLLSGHLVF
ncbi:MAG: hypothetical protein KatS3mg109_1807 [Pirellulaceae bacterium]|nr:MAG: hypothetical protein KatS3mg109_1807 [Pirellulaceae bacterium]